MRSAAVAGAAIACVAAATACSGGSASPSAAAGSSSPSAASPVPSAGGSGSSGGGAASAGGWNDIPRIVQQVEPSVVTIRVNNGLGSGVVWSSDGTVVTDAHVACGTDTPTASCRSSHVEVQFADGQVSGGTVTALDPVYDVAVVKTQRRRTPQGSFTTTIPRVGDLDVVIGSPLGLENTVTAGIISAVHRDLPGSQGHLPMVNLVQTDAPISPGNSGGAVVDGEGKVVGLAEAYLSPQNGAVAIGFFTPSSTVVPVVKQLLSTGHVSHAFLGVADENLTPQIAQRFGLSQTTGVLVLQVNKGTPAAQAGLQPGDIIVGLDGRKVQEETSLFAALLEDKPGQTVPLTYVRQGHSHTTSVTLGTRPS